MDRPDGFLRLKKGASFCAMIHSVSSRCEACLNRPRSFVVSDQYVMTRKLPPTLCLNIIVFSLLLSACGGGSGPVDGRLVVNLTDAPVDQAQAVVIHFSGATVQMDSNGNSDGQRSEFVITDPVTGQPGRSINLLALNSGKSTVLFDEPLPAGQYSWIRLDVDFDPQKTYIQIAGNRYPLSCVSCENNGLKLHRSFSVGTGNALSLTLDFDLRKSITDPASSKDFKLRPTIRIVSTAPAGSITGLVSESLISLLGGVDGCSVYIYEGSNVMPGDIDLPLDGSIPVDSSNPGTTARVRYNDAAANYEYRAAYLPAGDYTVSLTCDAELDDPLVADTGMVFTGTGNTAVTAGEITNFNFNVPPPG